MRDEVRKVLYSPYALILLCLTVLINGAFFYRHCIGPVDDRHTYPQLREKFRQRDKVAEELAELDRRIDEAFETNEFEDDSLLTGDIFSEYHLDEEVQRRAAQPETVRAFWEDIQKQAVLKAESGLFGSKDSFTVRSILQVASVYEGLEGVEPQVCFTGGVEALTQFQITDLLLLVFLCVTGLILLPYERSSGTLALLRPTTKGHLKLYLRKLAAMGTMALAGFLLLYGTNIAITAASLGFGELQAPAQSIFGMEGCPFPLTIGGFLVSFFALKLLWCLAVAAGIFLLCGLADQGALVMLLFAGAMSLGIWLRHIPSLWTRTLSLAYAADGWELLSGILLLNCFGHPVPQLTLAILNCTVVLLLSVLIGGVSFCKRPAVPTVKVELISGKRGSRMHTSLLGHECYKVFVVSRGAILLLLLAVLQLLHCAALPVVRSVEESDYRAYSQTLMGWPSPEKDAYLQKEADRFAALSQDIALYQEILADDPSAFAIATEELRQKLEAQRGFELARSQYQSLGEGQQYVYKTGYERLYGPDGQREHRENTGKLFLFLIVALSGVFAQEEETGVIVLQRTAGAVKKVRRKKLLTAAIYTVLAFLAAHVPFYVSVARSYGLPLPGAAAHSLQLLSGYPQGMAIWGAIVLQLGARLLLGLLASWVILALSKRTGSTIITIVASAVLLLIPLAAIGL